MMPDQHGLASLSDNGVKSTGIRIDTARKEGDLICIDHTIRKSVKISIFLHKRIGGGDEHKVIAIVGKESERRMQG